MAPEKGIFRGQVAARCKHAEIVAATHRRDARRYVSQSQARSACIKIARARDSSTKYP